MLSAMLEQAWLQDPDQSQYPGLFESLRLLYEAICAKTLTAQHIDAVGQAVSALPAGAAATVQAPPAAARTETAAGVPAGWPAGVLIPVVRHFIDALETAKPDMGYQDIKKRVRQEFHLSPVLTQRLISIARSNDAGMNEAVRRLCWNVVAETPLGVIPPDDVSSVVLNKIRDYQQQEALNGWPVPCPKYGAFPELDDNDRVRFWNWVNIIWNIVHVKKLKIGTHAMDIDSKLKAAQAFDSTGVYLAVTDLLSDDATYNHAIFDTLNRNNHVYVGKPPRENFKLDGCVAARTVQLTHAQIENLMMEIIESQPADTVFNGDSFPTLNYSGGYLWKRLIALEKRRRTWNVSSARNAKKGHPDRPGPSVPVQTPRPAGAQPVLDPQLTARWVGPHGEASGAAVHAVANAARELGGYNTNHGDVHVQALLNAIRALYDVNILVNPDHRLQAPGAAAAPPLLFAAPGGQGRPFIALSHQLVLGEDAGDGTPREVVSAHYEYAIPGLHDGWQETPGDGDCVYTCLRKALRALKLTPALLSVAHLRNLTAREIEDHPDLYRPFIPVATEHDLRLLAASDPDGP